MADDDADSGAGAGAPQERLWVGAGAVVGFLLGLLVFGDDGRSAVAAVALSILPAVVGGSLGRYAARRRYGAP